MPFILIVRQSRTTSHFRNGAAWEQIQTITDTCVPGKIFIIQSLKYMLAIFLCVSSYVAIVHDKAIHRRPLRTQMSLCLLMFFCPMCFLGNIAKSVLHDERHRPLRERPLRQHDRRRAYVKNGCAGSSNVISLAALHRPVKLTTV